MAMGFSCAGGIRSVLEQARFCRYPVCPASAAASDRAEARVGWSNFPK
jgi:hypothetical protein